MNNFASFLDSNTSGMNPNMPRQPPSPNPSQLSAGSAGGPGTAPMVNGLPSGGQQSDMNYLWSVVNQLTAILEENRAQTAGIVNSVQQLQTRAVQDGASPTLAHVNGELNTASRTAEIASLQSRLIAVSAQNDHLTSELSSMQTLLEDYENAIRQILEKMRPYAYNHTQTLIKLHAHYQGLLEAERQTNLNLRLEHQDWQTGLGRVAEYARAALRESSKGSLPYLSKIRELKTENAVLRKLAGWEEASDSEEEEDDEDEDEDGDIGSGADPLPQGIAVPGVGQMEA